MRKRFFTSLCVSLAICLCAHAADRLSCDKPNTLYQGNRAPLPPSPCVSLPVGSITAQGWLRQQLTLQAQGLTGRMDQLDESLAPTSGWLGGPGEAWERGPYYFRGLASLAYALKDEELLRRAHTWLDWSLEHQDADGYFGPAQAKAQYDWWPHMVALDALREYYSFSGDKRVMAVMSKYFSYQSQHLTEHPLASWAIMRGADNVDSILWLYNQTGEKSLLELAMTVMKQTRNYTAEHLAGRTPDDKDHVVNQAMSFKQPGLLYELSGDDRALKALEMGWQATMRGHGRPDGMFSGDENLHGLGPDRGTEFCAIVEFMYTCQRLLAITGQTAWADRLEQVSYNALPSITTPDFKGFQYYEQTNQVMCTQGPHGFLADHHDDLTFGPLTGYPCCRYNLHFGWPRLVHSLWMAGPENGLAAIAYAPCEVSARVADGSTVRIVEDTDYPFRETVNLTIHTQAPVNFPLVLRVPAWCQAPAVAVNGVPVSVTDTGWFALRRTFSEGDTIQLAFPAKIRTKRWINNAVTLERGPLLFALPVTGRTAQLGEKGGFPIFAMTPSGPWNYALVLDPAKPAASVEATTAPMLDQPWDCAKAPTFLRAKARLAPDWTIVNNNAGPLPVSPVQAAGEVRDVTLVPYGAAKLRLAMFPTVEN